MKNPLIRCVALLALLLGHIGLAGCAATQEKHAENDSIDNELADARYDEPEERVLVSDDRSNGKASKEIVCWGDSMTEGAGRDPAVIATGDGVFDASYLSYPDVLQKLTGMTTCNFGVSGALCKEPSRPMTRTSASSSMRKWPSWQNSIRERYWCWKWEATAAGMAITQRS